MNSLPSRIHFVGIGGIGMSALARVLIEDGHIVSGSDLQTTGLVRRLAASGARIAQGHHASNIGDAELVVATSAARSDNVELQAAAEAGIPIIKRAELLGRLMTEKRGIAVAGTHGKTTTSSMVSLILLGCGLDPTILVGGEIRGLESNARRGGGDWLVAEADEYDSSFLKLEPEIAVITNVEADHLDHYGSLEGIEAAFRQFAGKVTGSLVLCLDDPFLRGMAAEHPFADRTVGYSIDAASDWIATAVHFNGRGGSDFTVMHNSRPAGEISLAVPGRHNVLNALGATVAAVRAGIPFEAAANAIATFGGVHRRLEVKGEVDGITVIDDYGHHPTEVRVTLATLRGQYRDRRIVCLFQPHTYSRTKLLLDEFAGSFEDADAVRIADIYASRERDEWGVSSEDLIRAMRHKDVAAAGSVEAAADQVTSELKSGDVLLTLGAGDIYRAGERILANLAGR